MTAGARARSPSGEDDLTGVARLSVAPAKADVAPEPLIQRPTIHVFASEALAPELLRALARPEVVLWLDTRTNSVAPAIEEVLRGAGRVYVRARLPLRPGASLAIPGAPRAGRWCAAKECEAISARLGPTPLAARLTAAELPALVGAHAHVRELRVEGGSPDAGTLGELAQLGGTATWAAPLPVDALCETPALGRKVTFEVPAPSDDAGWRAVGGCSQALRLEVGPGSDVPRLERALLASPGLQLSVTVGADEGRARWARAMLEQLESISVPDRGRP